MLSCFKFFHQKTPAISAILLLTQNASQRQAIQVPGRLPDGQTGVQAAVAGARLLTVAADRREDQRRRLQRGRAGLEDRRAVAVAKVER